MDRGDGWPSLQERYGLPQRNVRGLDHDIADALETQQVQRPNQRHQQRQGRNRLHHAHDAENHLPHPRPFGGPDAQRNRHQDRRQHRLAHQVEVLARQPQRRAHQDSPSASADSRTPGGMSCRPA